jgi:acetate kinase
VISSEAYHHLEKLTDLAPLHNGAALSVIHATLEHLPKATSIAYFDTTFHRTIPPHISTYPLDPSIAEPRGLKKYGFHGLSYAYILRSVSRYLGKPPSKVSLIVLHLGSGASACAIENGKSLDTSMGLTPLHGLPGATRAGALDPATIFHYTNKAGRISHDKSQAVSVDVTEAEEILNKKAGWKALTGTSDFGEIVKGMANDDNKKLAFDLFVDRILDYVGSYYVKLRGRVDALVFAGGIGERSAELRSAVADGVAALGFKLLDKANVDVVRVEDEVIEISEGSGHQIVVCRTDEQEEMARECALAKQF